MSTTGLAEVISKYFVAFSTTHTLPFWSYIASLLITFLVPGGGHWAVQGPFVGPAAVELHASVPATAMSESDGRGRLQHVPVLGIAGCRYDQHGHPASARL